MIIVRPAEPADLPAARAHIMRVITEDLGYAYNPAWHWDVDDLQGTYLDDPRHALWVAVDEATGQIVATGGVRRGGPKSPPEVAARYAHDRTAQVVRVYVDRAYRRRGLARGLVELARRFAADEGGYDVICLHTDVRAPGAEAFWRSMPTTLVHDPGGEGEGISATTCHFELAFPDPSAATAPAAPSAAAAASEPAER